MNQSLNPSWIIHQSAKLSDHESLTQSHTFPSGFSRISSVHGKAWQIMTDYDRLQSSESLTIIRLRSCKATPGWQLEPQADAPSARRYKARSRTQCTCFALNLKQYAHTEGFLRRSKAGSFRVRLARNSLAQAGAKCVHLWLMLEGRVLARGARSFELYPLFCGRREAFDSRRFQVLSVTSCDRR